MDTESYWAITRARCAERPVVRFGAPQWLCSRPLTRALAAIPNVVLVEAAPAVLTARLEAGELECVLMPVIDCIGEPPRRVVPGMAIVVDGEPSGERLFARTEPSEIRQVGFNAGVGGAVALARVVLAEHFGAFPEFVALDEDPSDATEIDAWFVTGDAGLVADNPYDLEYDLAALWRERTALPWVQLVWAGRRGAPYPELRRTLTLALQQGLAGLETAVENASEQGFATAVAREYLTNTLQYKAGSSEMDSIRAFLRLAGKHGLCAEDARLTLC